MLADRAGMIMSPAALKSAGDQLRHQPGLRRAVQVLQPGRAGPHRGGQGPQLLRRRQGLPRQGRLQDHRRRHDPVQQPALRRRRGARRGRGHRRRRAARPTPTCSCSPRTRSGTRASPINLGNVNGVGKPAGHAGRADLASAMATDARVRQAFEMSLDRAAINTGRVPRQVHARPAGRSARPARSPPTPPRPAPSTTRPRPRRCCSQAGVTDAVQGQHDHRQHAGRAPGSARRSRPR